MSDSIADELHNRAELTALVYRYADRIDRRDLDGVLSCFTEDAHVSYDNGAVVIEGREELRQFMTRALSDGGIGADSPSTHVMANVLIELDGAAAHVETTAVAYLTHRPGLVVARGLRYIDDCRRIGTDWLIERRAHLADWQAELPGGPLRPGPVGTLG